MMPFYPAVVRCGLAFIAALPLWDCASRKPVTIISSETGYEPGTIAPEPYTLKTGDELFIKNLSWATTLIRDPGELKTGLPDELHVKINTDGEITLPGIGYLQAAGLTRRQLTDTLSFFYRHTARNPLFEIRVTNHRVKVLGAVVTQGVIPLDQECLTLAEILSGAGGIRYTEAGNTILIIRDGGARQRTISYTFDQLGDPLILNQPVFNNDIVYVPPSGKMLRTAESQRNHFLIQPVLTSLNLAVIALNIVRLIR